MACAEDLFVEFFVKHSSNSPVGNRQYYLMEPDKDHCPTVKEIESGKYTITYMSACTQWLCGTYRTVDEI